MLELITAGGTISVWGFVLLAVMAFVAGFVDAIAGGGGFISLPGYLFAGLPVHAAIATNKLSSSMGTTVATITYIRHGYMMWWLVPSVVVLALAGSALGASLSLASDENLIRIFMLLVVPIAAFYVIRAKRLDIERTAFSKPVTLAICSTIAFVIGIYDGFYGPGTGTFLMLLLPALGHLSLDHAAGITKAINLSTNLAALAVFLMGGAVIVSLGLCAGLFNIAGNYLGARKFTADGAKVVRPVILVVLALFTVRLILELLGIM
mgnify:CR=1 FL=1